MARPVSNNILYPFVPDTPRDNYIAGIKDIALTVHAPYTATVTVAGRSEAFAALQGVSATGLFPVTYTFGAFTPTGVTEEFYYREITFTVTEEDGFGSVQSSDGYSYLFVGFSEIIPPASPQSFGYGDYTIEPGCVRWVQSSAISIVIVNEQRLSEPANRTDLDNTVLRTFDEADPVRINEGYNVELAQNENDLQIVAVPGAGKGVAPDNAWEDVGAPVSDTPIKTINGQGPASGGDFGIDTSNSVGLGLGESSITIINNHPEA